MAAYDLTQALLRPRPASPVPLIANSMYSSLLELAKIFKNYVLSESQISSEEDKDELADYSSTTMVQFARVYLLNCLRSYIL